MSRIVKQFNPATDPPGPIATGTHSDYGLSILNESNIGLTITLSSQGSQLVVPAYYLLSVHICVIGDSFDWSQAYTVPTLGGAPISLTVVTIYQPSELQNMPPSGPLTRLTNVGNTIPVGGNVNQVINDGNPAPTMVVEGTPQGALSSQLKWNNDGSGIFGGGLITVSAAGIFTAIPNASIPGAAIQNGALPVGVIAQQVSNDGRVAGTRVLEATPQGQLQSGFVFFNDGHGNIASGALAWNTSGVFTSMPAGSVPLAGLQAGFLGTGIAIGSSTTEEVGYNVGGSGDVGIVSASKNLWLFGVGGAGENDIGYNMFWDGANFRYLVNGVANRLKFDGTGILEFFNYASGLAGAIVSGVKQGNLIQGKTAGGGSATNATWSGTTDPGASAAEGDTWDNV